MCANTKIQPFEVSIIIPTFGVKSLILRAGYQWRTLIIPTMWEAEVRRIIV
jgi:hypothetical protein